MYVYGVGSRNWTPGCRPRVRSALIVRSVHVLSAARTWRRDGHVVSAWVRVGTPSDLLKLLGGLGVKLKLWSVLFSCLLISCCGWISAAWNGRR